MVKLRLFAEGYDAGYMLALRCFRFDGRRKMDDVIRRNYGTTNIRIKGD